MHRFHWSEVSGDKDCIQCACLGETSILTRKLTLLQGNDASVKFACPVCGFVSVGVVSVDGSEVAPVEMARRSLPKEPPRYNAPAIPDPLTNPEYKPPKTDSEALQMAYGEMLEADDFIELVGESCEPQIKIGEWVATLRKTPTLIEMGQEKVGKLLVEYVHPVAGVVHQRMFSSTEGTPDMEAEMKSAMEACCAFAMPATMPRASKPGVSAPRGPVAVQSNGWGSTASVDNGASGDPVRERLFASFRGGG